ncbi:hypothetical protein IGL98_000492 [Enterococcus sp. DIV0840]|uniref:glucosaminidase domain-containing protein n=1 Tax=unclassified Enterococcus TaxID=2608891 RepID=UPI001A8E8FE0|nr:glucosaminidase domain-containing protein [Enterococcus sp. DIV0849a]
MKKKQLIKAITFINIIGIMQIYITPMVALADNSSKSDLTQNFEKEQTEKTKDSLTESESTTTSTSESNAQTSDSTTSTSTQTPVESSSESENEIISSSSSEEKIPTSSSDMIVESEQEQADEAISSESIESEQDTNEIEAPSENQSFTTVLPEDLKDKRTYKSDLNGFVLPLLSSFDEKKRAVIVAETLNQLGEKHRDNSSNSEFIQRMFQRLFNQEIGNTVKDQSKSGKLIKISEAKPGDLLFLEKNEQLTSVAIYLGQERYAYVEQGTKSVKIKKESLSMKKYRNKSERLSKYAVQVNLDQPLTSEGQQVLERYAANIDVSVNTETEAFISKIGESAQRLGTEYDVFPSVMIAQAILESGSGTSTLSQAPYYNLFGIKGEGVSFSTNEDDGSGAMYTIKASFRKYRNYEETLKDYIQLIRKGISSNENFYKGTWRSESKNYLNATRELTGKYATDSKYHNKLNSIIAAYKLTRFDEKKENDRSGTLSRTDDIPKDYKKEVTYPEYNNVNYNSSGSYPVGQCTWYVYNRFAQLGQRIDDYMGNGGDWGSKALSLGYKVSNTPTVGSAISFRPGVAGADATYGHVAFVEAVKSDGILISEQNVVGLKVLSYRVIPNNIAYSPQVTYIKP